jgi:hypothetical protein
MDAIANFLSRATGRNVDDETVETTIIFCGLRALLHSNKSDAGVAVRHHWRGPEMRQGGYLESRTLGCMDLVLLTVVIAREILHPSPSGSAPA